MLEHPTVELLRSLGLADRLDREGLAHRGIELAFDGGRHRIDFVELTGRSITVYGQQEVVKDLIAARLAAGGEIVFEAADVAPADLDTDQPVVRYRHDDDRRASCAAGSSPAATGRTACAAGSCPDRAVAERTYPFAWLGILAEAAPTQDELVYARHERGFALYSMRSPTVTRLYLQVAPDEHARRLARRPHLGRAGAAPADGRRLRAQHRPDHRARHHRRCTARWPRRCATATCCSPATPPTSSRRPAPRG